MESKKTTCKELFAAFFRIGLFTFGGGYAMLPMLERECVDKYGWTDREELLDYFAIGQCTPGVIAVNTATFVGTKERGVIGAAAATAGVVCPSLIIILIIAMLLENFAHIPAVQHAFGGIRVAVAALIANAVIKLISKNVTSPLAIILCIGAFAAITFLSLSPVLVVFIAAIAGISAKAVAK
ncbi:MAG: chromate transporter [Clostridia bacterium]|nr:chromate transporter [Clostridia bacterium]